MAQPSSQKKKLVLAEPLRGKKCAGAQPVLLPFNNYKSYLITIT